MKPIQRRTALQYGLGLASTPWLASHSAFAQAPWPDKPIKVILSHPAGSGPDNVMRLMSDPLARALGQPLVLENKPGGQNVIGAQAAARSAPDGYTFYWGTVASMVTNIFLFKNLPYDTLKDFVPVGFVGRSPFAILVKADSPIQSVQDLVERSKAAPGKVALANEGPRTLSGMIARVLNFRSKAELNLAPYASIGVAIQDTMGGHVDAVVADIASTAQLVRQGRLRMLAVTSGKRVAGWEQVPSLAETYPGFDLSGWFALMAPAGVPRPALERMNREFNTVLADREVTARILAAGPIPEPGMNLDQVNTFIKEEFARWAQVAKEIAVLPE